MTASTQGGEQSRSPAPPPCGGEEPRERSRSPPPTKEANTADNAADDSSTDKPVLIKPQCVSVPCNIPGRLSCVKECLPAGTRIQFWYEVDPTNRGTPLLCPMPTMGCGPQFRQSHGWLEGTLTEAFSFENYIPTQLDTWPFVLPSPNLAFADRCSGKTPNTVSARRLPPWRVRLPCSDPPALSLLLVRWGGEHSINAGTEGEGGWGKYGCPPSDDYMSAMLSTGLYGHPELGGQDRYLANFEVFSLFIKHSRDLMDAVPMAPWLVAAMHGRKKVSFWFLWPAEWEDAGGADYAGYVERKAMFATMRAYEAAGLRSGFPHPADLYELITSKSWLASLALHPQAHLPAAALVSKGSLVAGGPEQAAKKALLALEHIRRRNPFPAGAGERAAPSVTNKDGVHKGVVKLGWSWEGRFVLSFDGEVQLAQRLAEILLLPGCLASSCIVQEWVDFDYEMRLYFLPPDDWAPGTRLTPEKIECNFWAGFSEEGRPHTFRKMNKDMQMDWWDQDEEAIQSAEKQAIDVGNFLLEWLLSMDSQPVPMIRMDFMVSRVGPGKARVAFGEYCEMGACCLGWENGPPSIWRAALDSALR